MLRQADAIGKEEAQVALNQALQSLVFQRALRSQRFLQYLVECALAEPPETPKEYAVAINVFDRGTDYDPSVDATVRVEASRLRGRLREYYEDEGRNDPWRIEVPKGSYSALFTPRIKIDPREVPEPRIDRAQSEPDNAAVAAGSWKLGPWTIALLASTALAATLVALVHARRLLPSESHANPATVSLAILPIVNRSGEQQMDAASDGLTDDLIRQLSQIPALHLIARTTVFSDHTKNADPRILGRALGVDAVLNAEVRRTPDHIAIAAELSNTQDGSVLLDREYIVAGDDLRSVQAEIQRDLIAKLHLEASALDPGRTLKSVTSSPKAYQEFLDGNALALRNTPPEIHQAIGHFERAVTLDPDFDLAWSAMGSEHLLLGLYFEAPRDHMSLARRYAEHALSINPALGAAHGDLGLIHLVYDWDMPAADAEMARAGAEEAAINSLACTAHLMERAGHPRTAEAMLTRMLTFNPQSSSIRAEMGCVNYYQGNYDAALRVYRETVAADPHAVLAYWGLGKTLSAEGKYREAVAALDACKKANGFEPPLLRAETGYAYGAAGRREAAMAVVKELTSGPKERFVDPYLVAMVFASMNDRTQAFSWLQKGVDVRSPFMIALLSDPKWEPFRSDPRFASVIKSMLHAG